MNGRPILCAFDFSDASEAALLVAEDLARRTQAPLFLVHVLEPLPLEPAVQADVGPFYETLIQRAAALEDSLRKASVARLAAIASKAPRDVVVRSVLLERKQPWEALAGFASQERASLIVMGTHGRHGPARWLLGSVAERTIRSAACPVIVVPPRGPTHVAWSAPNERLRIAVGLDLGDSGPLALVRSLREAGPCDVTAIHLFWPPAELKRQQLAEPIDIEKPSPEMAARCERDVRQQIGSLPGEGELAVVTKPEWGRLADPLAREARAAHAHLLVIGSYGRLSLDPLSGRASSLLRHLELPVAFVPPESTVEEHATSPSH